jgi:hypothetical protein
MRRADEVPHVAPRATGRTKRKTLIGLSFAAFDPICGRQHPPDRSLASCHPGASSRSKARRSAGEAIAAAFRAKYPDAGPEHIEAERERLVRAPLAIAVVNRAGEPHVRKGYKVFAPIQKRDSGADLCSWN